MPLKCLSKINFFKVPVRLKINKADYYSSRPGEIMSLFILSIQLYMLATHDLFYKNNPETFEKSLAFQNYFRFNMTSKNFFVAAKLAGFGGVGFDYDPSIYKFQATYVTSSVNESGISVQNYSIIDMVLCKSSPYYQDYKFIVDIHPTAMCLPKSEFQLYGSYIEEKISKFFISLLKCENSTLNNNFCKSPEEIDKFLDGKYFAYAYFDKQIDLKNYLKPLVPKTPALYKAIEPKIRKRIYYSADNALIKSDVGFLLESIEEIKTWIFEQNFEDFDFSNDKGLIEIHFLASNIERTFIRRYKKVQDAMASLGGMLNFLIVICYFFFKLLPFTGVDYLLSKKIFSHKKIKKKRQQTWKEIKKKDINTTNTEDKLNAVIQSDFIKNMDTFIPSNCKLNPENFKISGNSNSETKSNALIRQTSFQKIEISPIPFHSKLQPKSIKASYNVGDHDSNNTDILNDQRILENFQKKIETMQADNLKKKNIKTFKKGKVLAAFIKKKNKINSIDISTTEFLTQKSRNKLKKKLKLLILAKNKIKDQLDIKNILEKLHEIDKIKYLLLNPQQLLLFQLISKPEILTEDEDDEENYHNAEYLIASIMKKYEETSDEKIEELVIYYNEIKNKAGKEDLDSRLLNLLDDDVRDFLECDDLQTQLAAMSET